MISVQTLKIANSKLESLKKEKSRHSRQKKTLMAHSSRLMSLMQMAMRCRYRFSVRKFRNSITTSNPNRFTSSKTVKSNLTPTDNSKLVQYWLNRLFLLIFCIFCSNKGECVMTASRDTVIVVANEDNSIPFFAMKHHLISDV